MMLALLAADGAAIAAHMIARTVPFEDASRSLRHLVADRPDVLQLVFEHR